MGRGGGDYFTADLTDVVNVPGRFPLRRSCLIMDAFNALFSTCRSRTMFCDSWPSEEVIEVIQGSLRVGFSIVNDNVIRCTIRADGL